MLALVLVAGPLVFDASPAHLVKQTSIAERHLNLPQEIAALPAPVDAELVCRIGREQGEVQRCDIAVATAPQVHLTAIQETYAQRLARAQVFDTRGMDRSDPEPLVATLRVRLDPADRRPIDFLNAPRTPLAQVEFVRQPEQAAPVFTLVRQHFGTPQDRDIDVVIRATCRIEVDGSLLCGKAEWTEPADGPLDPRLRELAYRTAARHYEAAPKLRDGTPSAGRVIELDLHFRNF